MGTLDIGDALRRVYAVWARGGLDIDSTTPAGSDELADLWPHLQIVEAEERAFRYRFVGAAIQADLAFDITGTRVGSRLYPVTFAADMIQGFAWVRDNARPLLVGSRYRARRGLMQHVMRLLLPLDPAAPSTRILVARARRSPLQPSARGEAMRPQEGVIDSHSVIGSAAELDRLLLAWAASDEAIQGPSPVLRLSED